MADKRILQERVVKFGITGMDEIYDAQKKIAKNAKDAMKGQKELLKSLTEGTKAYEEQVKNVKKAEAEYQRQNKILDDLGKQVNTVMNIINDKTVESSKKITTAIKAITKGVNSISLKNLSGEEAEKLRGHLSGLVQELNGMQTLVTATSHGFKDMTAPLKTAGLAYSELARYVKMYEQNGRALAENYANSSNALAKMGENATNAKVQMGMLDGTLRSVSKNTNVETLQAYIKGWKEIGQYGGASAKQIQLANENIAKAEELMRGRMQARIDNANRYSSAEVREAVEYMKQYANATRMNNEERQRLNATIMQGEQYIKQLTMEQQRHAMSLQLGGKQFTEIRNLSDASLASQKKYWQEMVAGTKQGTAQYDSYLAKLKAVTEEEARRSSEKTRAEGAGLVAQVNSTSGFSGTIKQTEEAIQKIQAYKKELNTKDEQGAIIDANTALGKLNEMLAQTKLEANAGSTAFQNLEAAAKKGVDDVATLLPKSTTELKNMRDSLEAYKKSLSNPNTEKLQSITTMLTAIDKKQREVAASEIKWSDYKGTALKQRSLTELRHAYDVLKKEIEGLTPAQASYNEKALQMREIDKRVKALNRTLDEHKTSLEKAAKILKDYFLIYFGFQKIIDFISTAIRNTIELSDKMTNVQKVTGLATHEIERMTHALQDLDTRTPNAQLMEMAEQAGKLGIATREGADGIVSFVKAGEQILNTLGDIGGAETITELLKVNDVVNKNSTSIETDLGRIGSAILNVGNNSKAAYASVVDFTKRFGSTGASLGLELHEIMGLAGAYSALGEESARSATATQRVMMGIVNHTREVSQALNISYAELDKLVKNGNTLEAFEMALSALNEQGASSMENFFKAIGGKNNQQARAAITLLSQHLDQLNYQVMLAKEGFQDGTLVTQEFEKANNNLAGIVARIKNEIYEMTVSVEGSNGVFLTIAKSLLTFVQWLRTASGQSALLGAGIAYLMAQIAMLLIKLESFKNLVIMIWGKIVLLGKGFRDLILLVTYAGAGFFNLGNSAQKATAAMNRLKAAGMTNWATALAVAIGALVGWIMKMREETKEAAKEIGAMKEKVAEETHSLYQLTRALRSCWENQDERNKYIIEFNKKFGEYYGHLLSETSSLQDLAIAYQAVSAAIYEKNAAELEGKAVTQGLEISREEREEASGEIADYLSTNFKKLRDSKSQSDALTKITSAIISYFNNEDGKEKTYEGALKYLEGRFKGDDTFTFENGRNAFEAITYSTATQIIGSFTKSVQKYVKAAEKSYKKTRSMQTEAKTLYSVATDKKKQEGIEIYKQLTNPDRTLTDKEKLDLATRYLNLMPEETGTEVPQSNAPKWGESSYLKTKKRTAMQWMNYSLSPNDQKEALSGGEKAGGSERERILRMLPGLLKSTKPWGQTSSNLDEKGGEELAAIADYFNRIQHEYKEGQIFTKTNAYNPPSGVEIPQTIDYWNYEQVRKWAKANWDKVTALMRRKSLNDSGNFRHESGDGSKTKRPETEEALAELKRYYSDREEVIMAALANGSETEEENKRKKLANDIEFYEKEAELRKYFDGVMEKDEETRLKEWWESRKDLDDGYWREVENLRSVAWGTIDAEWNEADAKAKGENRRLLQQDLTKRMTLMAEYTKKIRAALLDYMPMEKVLQDFRKSIDELDLLYGMAATRAERSEAGGAERRMGILHSYLTRVGGMRAEEFHAELTQQKDFAKMTEDETKILYERLLQLREDYENAARKKARTEIKLLDNRVESGQWYEEQLEVYRRYLMERLEAQISAKSEEERIEAQRGVDNAKTILSYMNRRQNIQRGGESVSYTKLEKERLEAMKQSLKTEEAMRNVGVKNERKIAEVEQKISAQELKMLNEKMVTRRALYHGWVDAQQAAIAQEKRLLENEEMTDEERIAHQRMIGNMETELAKVRQMNEEAIKDLHEETLEKEREFVAKEAALMSQRLQSVTEIQQGLNESLKEVLYAASSVYESTQANIVLEEYRQSLNGVNKEMEKTKYVIYNSKGVIEEVWLTPLEKLKKEQELAIKNARAEAWGKYVDELSKRMNEGIENAIKRGIAQQQMKETEEKKNKVVEDSQKASLAIQVAAEKTATDQIYEYKMQKLREYLEESELAMAESRMKMMLADEWAGGATGGQQSGQGGNGMGISGAFGGEAGEDIDVSSWDDVARVMEAEEKKQEAIRKTGEVAQSVEQQTTSVHRTETKKQTELSKTMTAALIQSANLYAVAYGVAADQNLSTQEKVNTLLLESVGNAMNSLLSALLSQEIAKAAAGESGLISNALGNMHPLAAAAIIAAGTAAIGFAVGTMKSRISKGKAEIASATGASNSSGKLATGMLTYANGRYPVYGDGMMGGDGIETGGAGRTGQMVNVMGNDGKMYNARYQPRLRTGVVNTPHLGIVGEAGAEVIIDHQTYEGLKRYDPDTLRRIYAMKAFGMRSIDFGRTARMGNDVIMNRGGVRAYADGNVEEKLGGMDVDGLATDGTMADMKQTLSDLATVLASIKETGIEASINYFGKGGMRETDRKGKRFMQRMGMGS